jgi:Fe-S cluster biosynthesis and repair protein YggX
MAETRIVHCLKLGKDLPGMPYKPFDNDLGQKIYDNISMDAWRMWLEHSKMVVNEYRLDLTSPRAQQILLEQAEQFFFGEGAQLPPDYKPPAAK